jgi:3-hexulose-6-phosphate synthase
LWFDLPPSLTLPSARAPSSALVGAIRSVGAEPAAVDGSWWRNGSRSGAPGESGPEAGGEREGPVEPVLVPLPLRGRVELRAPIDPASLGETLGQRHLQVALDVSDLDEAAHLARVAASNRADLIEVGDPLLKPYGMQAVREIRSVVPHMPLVVEFSSSDWIDQQIDLAVDAGADIVLAMGVDQPSRIERAVHAARENRVGILLAIPNQVDVAHWCSMVENTGADGISIIRNIDSAESAVTTGIRLRHVARSATVPLAVSGGFTPHNIDEVINERWNILIVGGAFVRARQPADVLDALRRRIDGIR